VFEVGTIALNESKDALLNDNKVKSAFLGG
jgi:hypothetical protein